MPPTIDTLAQAMARRKRRRPPSPFAPGTGAIRVPGFGGYRQQRNKQSWEGRHKWNRPG